MEGGDAGIPGSPTPAAAATLSNRDVKSSADQAAKPMGTGMFIPLVGRTCSGGRNKPNRRRNLTTTSLQTGMSESGRPMPRRNISTASLTASSQQQLHHMSSTGSSGCGYAEHVPVLYMQQQCASVPAPGGHAAVLRGPGILLPVADACAPAHTVMSATGQQGFSSGPLLEGAVHCRALQQQAQQQQQQGRMWAQPQQVSPFAAMSVTAPCVAPAANSTNISMGSDAGIGPLGIHQALSLPADAPVYPSSAQQYPSTTQPYPSTHLLEVMGSYSSQGLTSVGSAACKPQDSLLMQGVVVQGGSPLYQGDVLMSSEAAARTSFSLTDGPAGQLPGIVSASVLLPGPNPQRADVLSQANALGMSEQDLMSAVAAACSSSAGASGAEQDELLHSIKQLSMLREVLQLKHQHKMQQCLLQLQQQQQHNELLLKQQQVLAGTDRSAAWQSSSSHSMQLQQAMLQVLPHEGGSGVLLPGTTAAAAAVDAFSDGITSMAGSAQSLTACNTLATPNMLPWPQSQQQALQQQQLQLDPQVLPAQNAASLGYLLQDRLSLHPQQLQQSILSAPSSITASITANGVDPTQCMVVHKWGQMPGM